MSYFEEKVKRLYKLHKQNKAIQKAYAVVEKDGKYICLTCDKGKYKYCIAGGSIEDGEKAEDAVAREILEELNINARVIKSLGSFEYFSSWEYKGKKFDIKNHAEIFLTTFVSYGDNTKLGLEGEFSQSTKNIEISKEEMLANVAEFVTYGIKLD